MILMGWVNYYGNFFMVESVCPTGKKNPKYFFTVYTIIRLQMYKYTNK